MMIETTSTREPLYSTLAGDPDLGMLVELFVQEMPGRVETLLEQLAASDWVGLRRTAHQLKGAGGSYGFATISPSAARLEETIVRSEPEEQIQAAVKELAQLCLRARTGVG